MMPGGEEDVDNSEEESSDEERPFSDGVLTLAQLVQRAGTKDERNFYMQQLAAQFADDHDETDASATDTYHAYIDDFRQAQLQMHQASLRLARLSMQCIDTYMQANQTSLDAVVGQLKSAKPLN